MEFRLLKTVDFEIVQTSAYRFLERYSKIAKSDSVNFFVAQYLLELALLDSKMNQYAPSLQASTALYVAMRVTLTDSQMKAGMGSNEQIRSVWTKSLQEQTGYTTSEMKSCAKNYFQLANLIMKSELQAILKKFYRSRYLEAGRIMCEVIKRQNEISQSTSSTMNTNSQPKSSSHKQNKTGSSSTRKQSR